VIESRRTFLFPEVSPGSYLGSITLEDETSYPLYIERVRGGEIAFATIFHEDWRPQLFLLTRVGIEPLRFAPLSYETPQGVYELSGEREGERIAGVVRIEGRVAGNWQVGPFRKKEEKPKDNVIEQLRQWLSLKNVADEAAAQLAELSREIQKKRSAISRLTALSERPDELKQKVTLNVSAFEQQKGAKEAALKAAQDEFDRQLGELKLLRRIKRKGKGANLARKILSREERWYVANWKATEDVSGLENYLSTSANINLRTLEYEYERALEKQSLQQQLLLERRRIATLTKPRGAAPGAGRPTSDSWWDKLWR